MTFQAPISRLAACPASPPCGVLMSREVSDHRWHFATAMRSIGAAIGAARGIPSGRLRSPAYVDLVGGDLREARDLLRRRAGWQSRPDTLVMLVSPGPGLLGVLGLAAKAEAVIVVVARPGDTIETMALDLLALAFVADGDELAETAGRPRLSWLTPA